MITTLVFWMLLLALVPLTLAILQVIVQCWGSRGVTIAYGDSDPSEVLAYCPNCWCGKSMHSDPCPSCGYRTSDFDALQLEAKLIFTLKHPARERRMAVIQLLGEMKCRAAIPSFEAIIHAERDPLILAEIARALDRIGGDENRTVLGRLTSHRSSKVRKLVDNALGEAASRRTSDRSVN